MATDFPALRKLRIHIHDGLVSAGTETVRLKDIRRLEITDNYAFPFGSAIRLIAHGTFGKAILAKTSDFLINPFTAHREGEKLGRLYGAAKLELAEFLQDDHDA